jgi:hypothetical protein
MHSVVNQNEFVKSTLDQPFKHLDENSEDVQSAVATAIGSQDLRAIAAERANLTHNSTRRILTI